MLQPPRYTTFEFPPYTYVPGQQPHPLSHRDGHRCPGPEHRRAPDLQKDWRRHDTYLWGLDLFNHGFFWEAHEAWEQVWLDAKSHPQVALWIKGLIKLAAAGVKALEGQPAGVRRHASRAAEIFAALKSELPLTMCGLNTPNLENWAKHIANESEEAVATAQTAGQLLTQYLEFQGE